MNNKIASKMCPRCKATLPVTSFYRDKNRKDGCAPYCKSCHSYRRAEQIAAYKERNPPSDFKTCAKCKITKTAAEFFRNRSCSTGLDYQCKVCKKASTAPYLEKRLAKLRQWAIDNPEKDRRNRQNRYFKKKLGITLEERDAMVAKQDGRCAICGEVPRLSDKPQNGRREALCVDHCHKTGRVRGLLCDDCNRGLGIMKDDETILQAAIEYLRKYKT